MKLTKILGLIAFILFSGFLLRGQGWIKTNYEIQTFASVSTKDNGFVAAGVSPKIKNDIGVSPVTIYRSDAKGNIVWQKDFYDIDLSGFQSYIFSDIFHIIQGNDNGFVISISLIQSSTTQLIKIDENGNKIWANKYLVWDNGSNKEIIGNKAKTNYCFYSNYQLLRIANNGDLIRRDSTTNPNRVDIRGLALAPANSSADFIAIGLIDTLRPNSPQGSFLYEVYENDSTQSKYIKTTTGTSVLWKKMVDDGYLSIGTKDNLVQKMDANFQTQWNTKLPTNEYIADFAATPDTGFIIASWSVVNTSPISILKITRYNKNGNIVWEKKPFISYYENFPHSIFRVGYDDYIIGYINNSIHLKINGDGDIYTTKLSGQTFNDQNNNCKPDPTEPIFKGQSIVSAYKNATNETFYGSTDSLGKYTVEVDTGNYVVKLLTPNYPYWTNCTPSVSKAFLTVGTKDTVNFALKPNINCPAMVVDISTPFVRRCFQNTYFLRYCNQGTTTAQNARIEVKFDSLIEYVSATRPLSSRTGQTLIFNLGNVAALDCGTFSVTTRTRCGDSTKLGQTLCSEAKIYPDTICNPPANWSGANVAVNGRCDRDSVRFTIRNTSSVPTASLKSIIVEDEIVFFRDNRSILPNSFRTIAFPANGKTWRINQDQEPNNPRNVVVTAVVEGCRLGNGAFSTGFVNDFPNSTGDPSVSVSCMPIVGSFDPNEKLAFPEGFKNEHFIEQNTAIDYQIGFQNTGTDTAFTIVVRDTLIDALDISSLKLGASSHNYTWELTGKNVLSFTFDNIRLVDSFKNEAASHGFVKFRINQAKDVKLGTRIENKAAIFFDFNAPIFTNKTFHNVGVNLLRVSVESILEEKTKVKVYPNPFSDVAVFEIDPSVSKGIFELFDLTGKVLRRETFENPSFEFHKKDLPTGVYIFKITNNEGQIVGKGKIFAR